MVLGFDTADRHSFLADMAAGLGARAANRAPSERARPFYYTTFVQLAHAHLVALGQDPRGVSPTQDPGRIAALAMGTSDFVFALANESGKIMLDAYRNSQPSYRRLAVRKTFTSFRPTKFLRAGDFPAPLQIGESGEVKTGSATESAETVTLTRFARILSLSRESLVNDDVAALADIANAAGQRAADFENASFFATCILPNTGLGATLSDGLKVFDAGHSNIGAGGVLSAATINAARSLLKKQSTPDGIKLSLEASTLLVSPDYQGAAEELVAPGTLARSREAGALEVIADSNLTTARFYCFAAPERLSNYAWGYLSGFEGPRIEAATDYERDSVQFKLSLNFGCGATESRAASTGAGA